MKLTQIASKILRGILLYATIIYFGLFVMSVDSLSELGEQWFFGAFGILIVLLIACYFVFKNRGIEDLVPPYLR